MRRELRKILLLAFILLIATGTFAQENSKGVDLVDHHANKKTRALYANLKYYSGKKLMFGHQDDLAYGVGWKNEEGRSDVKDVSGSYPAVYGWDISKIGNKVNIDGVNFENMVEWIKEGYERGGVITLSWHMDNPVTKTDAWDTTSAVKYIIPGGKLHDYYKSRLDEVAGFIEQLRKWIFVEIPVIFRPFHEHTGSWFWWGDGNCTPEEYKQLWQFTVKYLRDEKNLHNILYAYSTDVFSSREQYLKFYPGDDFVDILAMDDYHGISSKENTKGFINRLVMLTDIAAEKGKVSALSETGLESIPNEKWWTDILLESIKANEKTRRISWVLVWRNANQKHHYAPYPGHPSERNFLKFYQDEYTWFESDLPNLYKMP